MDWQYLITVGLVAGAAIYMLTALVRAIWGKKVGCGSACGKCATPVQEEKTPGRIQLPQV
jgi:bacterioferritin-associated ferredoxin